MADEDEEKARMEKWASDAAYEDDRIDTMQAALVPPEWLAFYAYKRGEREAFRNPGFEWADAIVDVARHVGARDELLDDVVRERDGDDAADEVAEVLENPLEDEDGIAPDHDEQEPY